jgi:hypothetical protein
VSPADNLHWKPLLETPSFPEKLLQAIRRETIRQPASNARPWFALQIEWKIDRL